jgi:3-methyladenine DNA glycosylase Tag
MATALRAFGFRSVGACVLAASLASCGLLGDSATNAVVAPGKFNYYSCEQLARTARELTARERELSELMARAAQEPVGKFVGRVSYGTELMQARGQLEQISQIAAEKNCAAQSKWLSDRALW